MAYDEADAAIEVAIPSRGFTWFERHVALRRHEQLVHVAIPSRGFTWFERTLLQRMAVCDAVE